MSCVLTLWSSDLNRAVNSCSHHAEGALQTGRTETCTPSSLMGYRPAWTQTQLGQGSVKSKIVLPISSPNSYQTEPFRKFPFDTILLGYSLIFSPLCFCFWLDDRAPNARKKRVILIKFQTSEQCFGNLTKHSCESPGLRNLSRL